MRLGHVYFVECSGRIKIGHSGDVAARVRSLATGSSHELKLICYVEGSDQLEKAIHRHLKQFRLKGEWFEDCPEVRNLGFLMAKEGASAIGFVEPPLSPARDKSEDRAPSPPDNPFHPSMQRISAAMSRYIGESVWDAMAQEEGLNLPPGAITNGMIGGFCTKERYASAFDIIRDTLDRLGDVIERWKRRDGRRDLDEQSAISSALHFVQRMEYGLQKLFSNPDLTIIDTSGYQA